MKTALLSVGFRPFFLGAGLWASLASLLWGLQLYGVALPLTLPTSWHAHEMVFGFGGALVCGFLLTAVPNWTKSSPLSGAPLALLFSTWIAGRVAGLLDAGTVATVLSVVAALGLFVWWGVLAKAIFSSRNTRNYGVLVLALTFATAHAVSVAVLHQGFTLMPTHMPRLAVLTLGALMALIGGRITPLFTRSHCKREGLDVVIRDRGMLDHVALGSLVLTLILWELSAPTSAVAVVAVVATLSNTWRVRGWGGWTTWNVPLVTVLHFGYIWIAVAMALIALNVLWPERFTSSWALHALSAGAMGTYGLGMMSRVSLGHTGRALVAPLTMGAAFVAMVVAGLLRVFGVFAGAASAQAVAMAAVVFAAAFGLYVVQQAHMLVLARPDGK